MSVIDSSTDAILSNLTPELKGTKITAEADIAKTEYSPVEDQSENSIVTNDKVVTQEKSVEQDPLTAEQLEEVAQQLQDFVGDINRGLEFSVDKDSGRDVIKVIDKDSGDLVKQYPSEEVLTLVAKLSDMVGGFIDAKV